MKYWIFQNNQVLGPYTPEDLRQLSTFSPESLVCPEGRRGTNMGDWQRAGMIPDLSAALVRVGAAAGATTASASRGIEGLTSDPTLKDVAALRSLPEKVAMLEDVVRQLQEGLRAKDTELSSVHGESAELHREAEMLKRQLAGLEERLASVRTLSDTLDKAVDAEKRVEHDIEKQGQILNELTHGIEELRRQVQGKSPEPPREEGSLAAASPADAAAAGPAPAEPLQETPIIPAGFDPLSALVETPAPETAPGTASSNIDAAAITAEPTPAPAKRKTGLLFLGVAFVVAAAALFGVQKGYLPGIRKISPSQPESAPVVPTEPAPVPEPAPTPIPPAPDPRTLAIDLAKGWLLPGGKTLGAALEEFSPPSGNLSPWMAEILAGGGRRLQVNYFARSAALGAPTIAYEFEVDLEGNSLVGRNAAAKSVLTGKAAVPPAPRRVKPVRVRAKRAAKTETQASSTPVQLPSLPGLGESGEVKAPEEPRLDEENKASDEALLENLLKE